MSRRTNRKRARYTIRMRHDARQAGRAAWTVWTIAAVITAALVIYGGKL